MLKLGELNIKDLYLGTTPIIRAYLGTTLVYQKSPLVAAWSAKGKTNEDEDRAILKDLTGNGHDITLNNFAFSGMSGYGGYPLYNFGLYWDTGVEELIKGVKYRCQKGNNLYRAHIYTPSDIKDFKCESYDVKISGLLEGEFIKYNQYSGINLEDSITINMYNGTYHIDAFSASFTDTAIIDHYYTLYEYST